MTQPTYQQWVKAASNQLAVVSDSAKLDARLLLCHGLSISLAQFLSWPDKLIPADKLEQLTELYEQRRTGRPMAYILGQAEFWGLPLAVSEAVLVPRPETETLVEATLARVNSKTASLTLLDLGTGSGAIALALASELPQTIITAVDASTSALKVASTNASQLKLNHVHFVHSNWFEQIKSNMRFDFIISNPPYVAMDDPHLENLTYEPDMALTADENGLADIRHIIQVGKDFLTSNGYLLIEHGFEQAVLVRQLFMANDYTEIETIQDLAGNDRVTLGRRYNG